MKSERKLNDLNEGEKGIIVSVMPSDISERLKELGFTAGTLPHGGSGRNWASH